MPDVLPCERLPFDSDFFGFTIARLNGEWLDAELVRQVDAWCQNEAVRCLYFLAPASDFSVTRCAEQHGYHLVDQRLNFEVKLGQVSEPAANSPITTRMAANDDEAALCTIARASYHDTRFYFDPGFPRQRCDDLYELWVHKSLNGYADGVVVACTGDQVAGYVTCHLDQATQTGKIGLVGVGQAARGQGVGTQLINATLAWFAGQGMTRVTVATQGRNISAQRLYQRAGFVTHSLHLWYHRWYPL